MSRVDVDRCEPAPYRRQATPEMASRGMKSAAELGADKPHGSRIRYYAGCRCADCRRANREYENERRQARKSGDHRGIVSAEKARNHIQRLRSQGIGANTIADAAKVPRSSISKIIYGHRLQIRAHTERRILQVTEACAPDRAAVDAAPSWALLDDLLACGWTKRRLASEIIGHPTNGLQIRRDRISVRNAYRVRLVWERLHYASVTETQQAMLLLQDLSDEGFHHGRVRRQLDVDAAARGLGPPDLERRNGRMHHVSVELITALHARWTRPDLLVGEHAPLQAAKAEGAPCG